jgi:glycosyltransferase 2 family protein
VERKRWASVGKIALKWILGALVIFYVGRHVIHTWRDLNAHGQSLRVDGRWIAASLVLYLVGLTAFGLYFGRVMKSSPTPTGYLAALRAYLISHIGKYVPGKAMVVVMRVRLVMPYGARASTAAFATLYETLTMMAAGGLIAALGFATWPGQAVMTWLGLGLGAGFLVVVWPKVFPRLSSLLRVPFPNVGPDALPRLSTRLLGEGLLWASAGWVLLGLSQIGVVRAIATSGVPGERWPLVIASVALATVAGFAVAVLPGGLGVREGVLMTALAPALGEEVAVVSALALRLTWVIGELLAAVILGLSRPPLPPAAPC